METKEIKINLPIDITTLDEIGNVTATIENGSIVITCEPKKKEFKYGDFVRIQKFLDDNNLVIDYEKKKIVKKRWRAEKDEINIALKQLLHEGSIFRTSYQEKYYYNARKKMNETNHDDDGSLN